MASDTPKRNEWRINLLAIAIVLATIVIGYGLAHPRDLPLPFGADAGIVVSRFDRNVAGPRVAPSPVALRDAGGRDAAPDRR